MAGWDRHHKRWCVKQGKPVETPRTRGMEMRGRPDPERIPQLKRRCYRIFAKYDPDPDNAVFQHAYIGDLMARAIRENGGDQDDEDEGGD